VAQTVTTGEQKISPQSDLFKEFLPTPTTPGETLSDSNYAGLVVVAVFKIGSKYIGITRSLATKSTLGIPKLLKWINKAQSEPCYKKAQLQSWRHFIFTRAQQPCLKWRVTTACELCISVQECYLSEMYMFCTHFTPRYFKSPSRRTLFCDKFAQLHNDEIPRLSNFAIKCRNAD